MDFATPSWKKAVKALCACFTIDSLQDFLSKYTKKAVSYVLN